MSRAMTDDLDRIVAGQFLRAERLDDELVEADREAERLSERLGLDEPPVSTATADAERPLALPSFDEVRLANEQFLGAEGVEVTSLDQFLTVEEIEFLESFDPLGRQRWTASDFIAVGLAGVIGVAATV